MNATAIPQDRRRQLKALRAQYLMRLEHLERERRRHGVALSADFAEQAGECENDEVVDALTAGTEAALTQIEHALRRSEAGLWGICEHCGGTIAETRLRKQPEVTRCTRCADSN